MPLLLASGCSSARTDDPDFRFTPGSSCSLRSARDAVYGEISFRNTKSEDLELVAATPASGSTLTFREVYLADILGNNLAGVGFDWPPPLWSDTPHVDLAGAIVHPGEEKNLVIRVASAGRTGSFDSTEVEFLRGKTRYRVSTGLGFTIADTCETADK